MYPPPLDYIAPVKECHLEKICSGQLGSPLTDFVHRLADAELTCNSADSETHVLLNVTADFQDRRSHLLNCLLDLNKC